MGLNTYFICGTPRSGSTLLCSLLKSSGIAGVPESYFRKQDLGIWAKKWGLVSSGGEPFLFSDYLAAAIAAGSSKNGVCATRLMWGTLDELVDELKIIYPDDSACDADLITRAFGQSRFIYLKRGDFVAQAVSLVKALQTDVWHVTEGATPDIPEDAYKYDFDRIHAFVREIVEHNAAWLNWFQKNNIVPHEILYEDLSRDPVAETLKVLDYLGLQVPSYIRLDARNRKMADDLSAIWIKRYHVDIEG